MKPPGSAAMGRREVSILTRQWATLLHAGVSLAPALQMLVRSASSDAMAQLQQQVLTDVEGGLPLSEALARHPLHFSPLYVGMVPAGESAGILDVMMARLASTLERNEALRQRVRSALSYPAVVVVVVVVIALSVLVLILLYVVPVFEEVFASFGASLPLSTRWVLSVSRALSEGWPWLALGVVLSGLWLRQQ